MDKLERPVKEAQSSCPAELVEHLRVSWVCTRIYSAEASDAIDEDRVVQVVEAVNAYSVTRLETESLEAGCYLSYRLPTLCCCPELARVFSIDVQGSILVK